MVEEITQQEVIFDTEVCKNKDEQDFEDDFGIEGYECSHFFVPENCRKESRKHLTDDTINEIKNDFVYAKASNSDKIVIGFFQTKKNTPKTIDVVKKQMSCGIFEGSDGVCIYETNIQQEPESFNEELFGLIEFTENFEKYMVFEIESIRIKEKLGIAINNGIRNFILIAGRYQDNDLWTDFVDIVRAEKGKVGIILPVRMHKTTKKAYMQQAIDSGANIVCHGKFSGGGDGKKERINLYLDNTDMTFKKKENLPNTNTIKSNNLFSNLIDTNENNIKKEYHISRLSALPEGSMYANTHKRTIILQA